MKASAETRPEGVSACDLFAELKEGIIALAQEYAERCWLRGARSSPDHDARVRFLRCLFLCGNADFHTVPQAIQNSEQTVG